MYLNFAQVTPTVRRQKPHSRYTRGCEKLLEKEIKRDETMLMPHFRVLCCKISRLVLSILIPLHSRVQQDIG